MKTDVVDRIAGSLVQVVDQIAGSLDGPGIHFPFPKVNSVRKVEGRVVTLDQGKRPMEAKAKVMAGLT